MLSVPKKVIRSMGFQKECRGVMDRYINVDGAWDNHLSASKDFIINALSGKKISDLAVLGSGWLLDFPLMDLFDVAERIWLYDIVHPRQIFHRISPYSQVRTVSADITGGAVLKAREAVSQFRRKGIKTPPQNICDTLFKPAASHDYIVSLNTVSQVGAMITSYLQQHIPYGSDELLFINKSLQQSHMEILKPGRSCLITDYREDNYDNAGQCESKELIFVKMPGSVRTQKWDWQFDPVGGYIKGKKTILKVIAMEI